LSLSTKGRANRASTDSAANPQRRNRKRLRTRIIWSVLAIGTLLSMLFAAFAILLRANLEERLIDRQLSQEVVSYAEKFISTPDDQSIAFSRIRGRVFSDRKAANIPKAWQNLAPGVHRLTEQQNGARVAYKLAVHRAPGYWFYLQYDVTAEERTRRLVTLAIVVSVLAFSGLALVLGIYASRRVMSPVADLLKRLTKLSRKGNLEPLAPHFADDEVGQLAQALDDYAHKLTELVERDREFNSDVSHELRTPLAVIQSTTELLMNMQAMPDKALQRLARIERASKQSTELITALLHLSRGEKQAPNDGENTDVSSLVFSIVDSNRHHLVGKQVQVEIDNQANVQVAAPESVISVVLGNLIGNAFKYTREGMVRVVVKNDGVTVEDSGPGIPEDERDKVFERHFRGSTGGGSGGGLGLSIARRLCALYGWQVYLKPRHPHGIEASLYFFSDEVSHPVAPP
jgi:signal transduction histidine kinase